MVSARVADTSSSSPRGSTDSTDADAARDGDASRRWVVDVHADANNRAIKQRTADMIV
jgi:hypothetical protein